MPKVDTSTMDPRTHVALADGRPLLRAIPKRYLCTLAQECGSQAALADKLSGRRTTVHRQDLNGWINGTKHMSNLSVIHVSHVLGVSPLCVLDLCGPNETEAPNETAERDALTTKLQTLCEWQRTGSKPARLLPGYYPKSPDALSEELAGMCAGCGIVRARCVSFCRHP